MNGVSKMTQQLKVVIITGMSGAGKTVAIQSFEDMGYYCIDNMPPNLVPNFLELINEGQQTDKIALVMDLRSEQFVDEIDGAIDYIEKQPTIDSQILYLDTTVEELVTRYKESRRSHPLASEGLTIDGIKKEKDLLARIKTQASVVVDTTETTPRELRKKLMKRFSKSDSEPFRVELVSFGFKNGIPIDADLVIDVRFLPNPFYDENLRELRGTDEAVYDFVMSQPATEEFYKRFMNLIEYTLPGYRREGKSSLTIAIGCTGGHHRSVALVERMNKQIEALGYPVNLTHRDINVIKESKVRS